MNELIDDPGNIGEAGREATPGEIEARAVAYALEAGLIAKAYFRKKHDITYKSKKMTDPITEADKEVESFLHAAIARDFPTHGVLGEEGTGTGGGSGYLWVLDPLDGTNNFINGLPFFAVSVGVLHCLKPIVGAIYAPVTHLGKEGVFHASLGGGAFVDDEVLRLEEVSEPGRSRLTSVPGGLGAGFKLDRELRRKLGEPRVMGSIALESALTAAGVYQFAIFGGPRLWDVAAGVLIVREAGGAVLVGSRESGEWETLDSFTVPPAAGSEQMEPLRKWARPIVVANPGLATFLAQHLKVKPRQASKKTEKDAPPPQA